MPEPANDPRYPIGKYQPPENIDASIRATWIDAIAGLPGELRAITAGLDDVQLDTPYREGGWTVRQLVHHIFDSHMNSMIRFRWALTEDVPLIKAYDEKLWAGLPDAQTLPLDSSLAGLDGLHRRWTGLLRQMTDTDFSRRLRHPEAGELRLDRLLGLYAWHGRHHVAHIAKLKAERGW